MRREDRRRRVYGTRIEALKETLGRPVSVGLGWVTAETFTLSAIHRESWQTRAVLLTFGAIFLWYSVRYGRRLLSRFSEFPWLAMSACTLVPAEIVLSAEYLIHGQLRFAGGEIFAAMSAACFVAGYRCRSVPLLSATSILLGVYFGVTMATLRPRLDDPILLVSAGCLIVASAFMVFWSIDPEMCGPTARRVRRIAVVFAWIGFTLNTVGCLLPVISSASDPMATLYLIVVPGQILLAVAITPEPCRNELPAIAWYADRGPVLQADTPPSRVA
jgi:hypothetical protein